MPPAITVGIPQALLYHEYGTVWVEFWRNLGLNTYISPPTGKSTLDQGVALAVDESCLPLKIYLGHVQALLAPCTHLFIPRLVCHRPGGRYYCAKFAGLPDIVANTFPEAGGRLLAPLVDAEQHLAGLKPYWAFRSLGISPGRAALAYRQALDAARAQRRPRPVRAAGQPAIALLGHSYVVQDPVLGGMIAHILRQCGAVVFTCEHIPPPALTAAVRTWPQIYWQLSARLAGAVHYYARQPDIDGVILLSSFGCGPDSLVNEFLAQRILASQGKPHFLLTLDEHNGTAGLATRLEAFVDLIQRRRRR